MKRFLCVIWFIFTLCITGQCFCSDQLIFGHSMPPNTLLDSSAKYFSESLRKKSNNRLKIKLYDRFQLGNESSILEDVRHGTVDLMLTTGAIAKKISAFSIFELPYLIRDRNHMLRIEKEVIWSILDPIAQRNGYKIVGVWEYGFRHIINRIRPVQSAWDLKGMKLRTQSSEWVISMFRRIGARPVTIPFSEVYPALQRGIIDGQEATIEAMAKSRTYEVQKYISLTRHIYTPAFLVMNLERWKSLNKNNQRLLLDSAKYTQEFCYTESAKSEEKSLSLMRSHGVRINDIGDLESFIGASKSTYDAYAESVREGAELLTIILR